MRKSLATKRLKKHTSDIKMIMLNLEVIKRRRSHGFSRG